MSPAGLSRQGDSQSSHTLQPLTSVQSPRMEYRNLTFTDILAIQRPPLPKGSQEFESLIAEFRSPTASSTSSSTRKTKGGKSSRPQHLLLQQYGGGSSATFSASHMASMYRRQGAALSLSTVLSQKRILKWLEKKQSGQGASPSSTARS